MAIPSLSVALSSVAYVGSKNEVDVENVVFVVNTVVVLSNSTVVPSNISSICWGSRYTGVVWVVKEEVVLYQEDVVVQNSVVNSNRRESAIFLLKGGDLL